MKKPLFFISLFAISFPTWVTLAGSKKPDNASAIFEKVAKSLTALKTVKYHYRREENYPSEGYNHVAQGDMYIDFVTENSLAGFRYQFKDNEGASVFNNSELFSLDNENKTITIEHITKASRLEGKSPLLNAFPALRAALPMIINDNMVSKKVSDTVFNKKKCYLLQFNLYNKYINIYLGNKYDIATIKIAFNYKIIADKATGLPMALLQTDIANHNVNRADFTEINTNPQPPAENSWFYSTYTNNYTLKVPGKPLQIIQPGATAPGFQLTNYRSNSIEAFSEYKGKVVMLEFWIKNCGHCIERVPEMNELQNAYKDQPFKLLAVNNEDTKNNIDIFVSKHPVTYDIMYGDKVDVAKLYGIQAFPNVVIVNKLGVVIYSGEFDLPKIKSVINGAI